VPGNSIRNIIFNLSDAALVFGMKIFDTHIHSEGRSIEDLAEMVGMGIEMAISCAFYPIQPLYPETLIDLFRKLTIFEIERGKKAGMRIHAAVGIHPRCIPPKYKRILDMEKSDDWVAFGEIGLESGEKKEVKVLKEQLEVAKKNSICHA
jgi:hypothetical protein